MIDVPVRVKDALKSGEYKKNYNITLIDDSPAESDEYRKIGEATFYLLTDDPRPFWFYSGTCNFVGFNSGDKFKFMCSLAYASFNYVSYENNGIEVDVHHESDGTNIWVELTYENGFENTLFEFAEVSFGDSEDEEPHETLVFDFLAQKEITPNFIENDNIIVESVKFDERMCSDSELKFGLCEGTSIEFQYFDRPNIYKKKIKVDIEAQYKNEAGVLNWHTIPMGYFDVDECSRQSSTGIIKATAINKLKSKYLDVKVNSQIEEILIADPQHQIGLYELLNNLLGEYSIGYHSRIKKQPKLYTASRSIVSTSKSQTLIWTYSHGRWIPPRASLGEDEYSPSSGYFTIYTADFYYIPADATDQYTDDYYEYKINSYALWRIARKFLLKFVDWFEIPYVYVPVLNHYLGYNRGTYQNPDCIFWENFIETTDNWNLIGGITLSDGRIIPLNKSTNNIETGDFTGVFPKFSIPIGIAGYIGWQEGEGPFPPPAALLEYLNVNYNEIYKSIQNLNVVTIYKKDLTPIEKYTIQLDEFKEISEDITLRDIQSAVFEINCQYGKLDRTTDLFSGIELNNGNLFPQDDLYPAEGLYPAGASEAGYPAMYEKLWADEGNIRKFRNLIITYKTTQVVDGQATEIEATLQRTVNADGTDDYNMSDNWLFRNFTWTSTQIGAYADAMVAKMRNISWFPFEMWCAGLPYLEAGDEIEINTGNGSYRSYVLGRLLKGVQDLHDEMTNGTLDIF